MRTETIGLAGGKLTGEWRHKSSRQRLIIICHGYEGSGKDPTITAIATGLNQKGYDTFTFTFSENTGGIDIEHQVRDVKETLTYFKDYDEIVLIGHSFGALTAAMATIECSTVKRLVTINGFFGQGGLGEGHRKPYVKFRAAALVVPTYRKILKYYKQGLQPNVIDVPVLVVHSKVDKYVLIKQSQDFYRKLTCPKQFIELKNANHGITSKEDMKKVLSEIHSWLS